MYARILSLPLDDCSSTNSFDSGDHERKQAQPVGHRGLVRHGVEKFLIRGPLHGNLLQKFLLSFTPFSIKSFARASVCARVVMRSS